MMDLSESNARLVEIGLRIEAADEALRAAQRRCHVFVQVYSRVGSRGVTVAEAREICAAMDAAHAEHQAAYKASHDEFDARYAAMRAPQKEGR